MSRGWLMMLLANRYIVDQARLMLFFGKLKFKMFCIRRRRRMWKMRAFWQWSQLKIRWMEVKYPPFSLSKCQYLPSSTSSLWIQAVSIDQVKEAGKEETEEEVKGEDETADVIQPNQKVTLVNSATNALVFGYTNIFYTFETHFLQHLIVFRRRIWWMLRASWWKEWIARIRWNKKWARIKFFPKHFNLVFRLKDWREPRAFAWIWWKVAEMKRWETETFLNVFSSFFLTIDDF